VSPLKIKIPSKICMKNQQINQLFIRFIIMYGTLLTVTTIHYGYFHVLFRSLQYLYLAIILRCKPDGVPWSSHTFYVLIITQIKLAWWWPDDGSKHVAFSTSVKYIYVNVVFDGVYFTSFRTINITSSTSYNNVYTQLKRQLSVLQTLHKRSK
jgi:hypothetical protein